jgi:hypothetical protein
VSDTCEINAALQAKETMNAPQYIPTKDSVKPFVVPFVIQSFGRIHGFEDRD